MAPGTYSASKIGQSAESASQKIALRRAARSPRIFPTSL
jgi:hypothetical protein